MKNWVILFVPTTKEEKLVGLLKQKLDTDNYLPFVPYKERHYRSKGITTTERRILFPGYVFVQTEIEAGLIAENLYRDILLSGAQRDIYKILNYGNNKKDVALRECERLEWEQFFGNEFCVEGSVGFIEGDFIRVTKGPLMGMESRIKKVNRYKREALVELQMMGAVREVRLMLEIIEKM